MSIIKKINKNYGSVPRKAMESNTMSLKAKGLLSYLLCMPENWQIYISQLSTIHKESKNTIAKIMNELIEHGYVIREQRRDGHKFAGYEYTVFDISQNTEYQKEVSQKDVSQNLRHANLSTNKIDSKEKDNTKKDNKVASLDLPFSSPEFKETWDKWCKYRKEIKKPMKDTTISMQLKKLEKWGEANAILSLNNSMENGYTGIFEPKPTVAKNATAQNGDKPRYHYRISGRPHEHSNTALFNNHLKAFPNHIEILRQ